MPSDPDQVYARKLLRKLKSLFPEADCTLDHLNPFQLLVATVLSAQCTDKRVNQITPALFRRFPTPQSFADAQLEAIEEAVQSTGFYHNKAKNIQALSRMLIERFGGEVPNALDALITLPGVGRKTANVVLGNAFGIVSGVVVDTHVGRLARRLGLSAETDPAKVERDLTRLFPKKEWVGISHRLILLGRSACTARNPNCPHCPVADLCPGNSVES